MFCFHSEQTTFRIIPDQNEQALNRTLNFLKKKTKTNALVQIYIYIYPFLTPSAKKNIYPFPKKNYIYPYQKYKMLIMSCSRWADTYLLAGPVFQIKSLYKTAPNKKITRCMAVKIVSRTISKRRLVCKYKYEVSSFDLIVLNKYFI